MLHRALIGVVCVLFIVIPVSGQEAAETPPILSLSVIPPLDPPLTDETFVPLYIETLKTAAQAGVKGSLVTETWSTLETSPGQFTLDPITSTVSYLNDTYDQTLMVGIQVINTNVKETPADLQAVPFDSPQMLRRFMALIDALAPSLDAHVRYLTIGNEVDAYLAAHPDEWETYTRFYNAAAAYVRLVRPQIQVGVTVTFGGARTHPDEVARLTASSDVYILTYYPLNPDLTVQPPDAPLKDFPEMLTLAGDKPLLLQEVGYPAAESLGSSEAMQAKFVHNVFAAWKAAGNRLPFLNYFAMGDFSAQMCTDFLTYYQVPDSQPFYDYLCTLGLRTANGTPREAWQAFVEEGTQR